MNWAVEGKFSSSGLVIRQSCDGSYHNILASWLMSEACSLQVKVLELEKTLENERLRLGELRRQHYALAGVYTENPDGGKPAMASKPGILKKPPVPQKPAHPLKLDQEVCMFFSLTHRAACLTK